jgi:signal peptidase II
VVKLVVERRLPIGARLPILPGVSLTHVHNTGIAFSLLGRVSWLLPAGIALTLVFLVFYNKARWTRGARAHLALALLAGGAIGNLVDRLRVGAVIDYVDLSIWPVFNLADVAVTVGAGLLLLTLLRPDGTLAREDS